MPRFHGTNIGKNLRLRSALEAVAREERHTGAACHRLANGPGFACWNFHRTDTRREITQAPEENVRAADIVLTSDDRAEINRTVPPGAASGTRYPTEQMHRLNV